MNRRKFFKQTIRKVARTYAGLCLLTFGGFLIKNKSDSNCIDQNKLCDNCPILQGCNEPEAQLVNKDTFV